MSHLLPTILRLLATTLTQIAELLEKTRDTRTEDEESLVQYTPTTTLVSQINPGPCQYCARDRIDPRVSVCYFHLNKEQKKQYYPET